MPKGRAASPRSVRWLAGGIAAVILAVAVTWVLFVPTADWIARHDVGSASGALHETALDNARGRLLTLGAGLLAAGALVFTALNFKLLRRNSEQTDRWQQRTYGLTEQGQVTDRYTKAIEQLGSKELDIRIGGIYALERIASDSARDHPTVMEVLTAFIRVHSPERWSLPESGGQEQEQPIRPDIQAALVAIGRRDSKRDIRRIDLRGAIIAGVVAIGADLAGSDLTCANLSRADLGTANLRGAQLGSATLTHASLADAILTGAYLPAASLTNAKLKGAILDGACLAEAILTDADLTGANLASADLLDADLTRANLTGANLAAADLADANLSGAYLPQADLTGADLTSADLTDTDLTGANLIRANLTNADLNGADLSGADLADTDLTGADFTRADLDGARWPEDVPLPEGWKRNTSTGRLEEANVDSG